jgi:hypothetical protein
LSFNQGKVVPGGTVVLHGKNWQPFSIVTLHVCNVLTVPVVADKKGAFMLKLTVPLNAPANCVITATGNDNCGTSISASTTLVVAPASTPPTTTPSSPVVVPPTPTGKPWSSNFYWLSLMVLSLLGLSTLITGWRRRRGSPLTS